MVHAVAWAAPHPPGTAVGAASEVVRTILLSVVLRKIHGHGSRAVVDISRNQPGFAVAGDENTVHPTVVISGDVRIGSRNYLGPGTILQGPLTLGDDNWIAAAAIGMPPEHKEWYEGPRGTTYGVTIGNRTVIREFVTIHSGHVETTRIGDECFLMTKSHVGHDAVLATGVTVAPAAMIGGHAVIGRYANLGMNCVIHQRLTLGEVAMVGMNSTVTRDIPDFALAYGSPARVHGANRVGLRHQGWTVEAIETTDASFTQ